MSAPTRSPWIASPTHSSPTPGSTSSLGQGAARSGWPRRAIRFSALERVHQAYVPGDNSTGAFSYFTRSGLCRVGEIEADPAHRNDEARLTLDEPEDLAFFRALFEQLYVPGEVFSVAEILAVLAAHPELLLLNTGLTERYFARHDDHVRRERLAFRTDAGIREVEAA